MTKNNFLRKRTGISNIMLDGSSMRKTNFFGNFSCFLLYLQARNTVQATIAFKTKMVNPDRAMLRVAEAFPIDPSLNCRREMNIAKGQTAQQISINSPYFTRYFLILLNNFLKDLLLTKFLEERMETRAYMTSPPANIKSNGEFFKKEA